MDDAIIVAALANHFNDQICSSPRVAPGSFVFFLDGTIPISLEHMKWVAQGTPFSPHAGPQGDNVEDAYAFAVIANTLPAIGTPWSASAALLGPAFRTWLDAAVVPRIELKPDQLQRLQQARDVIAQGSDVYHQFELLWRQAQRAWQDVLNDPHPGPDHQKQVLTAKQAMDKAMLNWQVRGGKSRFEAAVAQRGYLESLPEGLRSAANALRKNYDDVLDKNSTRRGDHFTPVRLLPSDLFGSGANWSSISIRRADISPHLTPAASQHDGGLGMPLFWTDDSAGQKAPVAGIDTENMAVSFQFAYGQIERSAWFDTMLLTSNNWWWPGATKSQPAFGGPLLSNGDTPPNTQGELQMIPTGVIFTRNLIVTTQGFDLSASEFALRAQFSTSAGFWIFTGQSNTASPLADPFDFVLDTTSLWASQMQVAAVVCQLMPKEPDPDTALLPD